MSTHSTVHATFTIERTYDVPPARVFAAWASKEAKQKWFGCVPDWVMTGYELDFREGGRERHQIGPAGGTVHAYSALYHDIVPNERIVFSYDMHLDATRISVSLTTIEFEPAGKGTRMVYTEQNVYLDGAQDPADREAGTAMGLESLARELQASALTEQHPIQ